MTLPRRQAPSRPSSRSKRLLFGLVTTMVFLAALEFGSRILGRVSYPPDPLIARDNARWSHARVYDPLLFWRLRPGSGEDGNEINRLGFRGPEVGAKLPDEFRVLSLGESTTYGWKIPYEASYSALLEVKLREGRNARIINAGVPGYTVFQGRVYLEHGGLDLAPDAVLLYFGYNDYLNVAFRERRDAFAAQASPGLTDRELFTSRRRWPVRLADWLYRRSNLFRWVGLRVHSGGESAAGAEGNRAVGRVETDPNLQRVPDDDRWLSLTETLELCRRYDIELVILIPWYWGFEEHAPLLRRFAAEHEVRVVDLPAALEHLADRQPEFFLDRSHPKAEGHRLIAEEIWRVVGERWGRDAAPGR